MCRLDLARTCFGLRVLEASKKVTLVSDLNANLLNHLAVLNRLR